MAVKYKEQAEYKQTISSSNTASMDLGEIHSITSIDSNGNAAIITGRLVRSFKRFRNKKQAELREKIDKCKPDSRQYHKYRKAMTKLSYRTKWKLNDALHKITRHYTNFCVMNDIKTVYYGDLDSATRNSRVKKKGNKMVRQKLSQWQYGELIRLLEPKLARHGIEMVKVKEYYTSQKCPVCGAHNKSKGRGYVCKCGYKQHRDIVGAINILNDNSDTSITKYRNLKYLQID